MISVSKKFSAAALTRTTASPRPACGSAMSASSSSSAVPKWVQRTAFMTPPAVLITELEEAVWLVELQSFAHAGVLQRAAQPREREPQARLHRADRQIGSCRDGRMRQAFEKGELHHFELLTRQGIERGADVLFLLRGGDAGVTARGRIRTGEQVRVRIAVLAAAAADVDAAIVGDTEHPGGGRRFATIEQMRLAPDRFHHVLGDVGGGERRQPETKHLGVHARPEMIEQHGERLVVAMGAHRGKEIVQLRPFGRSIFAAGLKFVGIKPGGHARYPSALARRAQMTGRGEMASSPTRRLRCQYRGAGQGLAVSVVTLCRLPAGLAG